MTVLADELPDATLTSRAQQGDRKAFEMLVGRYKEDLYRLLRRYLGNSDEAYDLLQDTLISVWESLARYDPKRSFFAWTRTIALNKCRDFSRRQRFRSWVRDKILVAEPKNDPLSPEEHAELTEAQGEQEHRVRRLDAAVAALPSFYKEALLLTAISGLSHAEAAAELRTSPKAIEMRVRRARQMLTQSIMG